MKAELLELQAELAQANANPSKSWADAGDIEDLEKKIEELEAQLS
jgi:cob(I)alamin adenosyltransferase